MYNKLYKQSSMIDTNELIRRIREEQDKVTKPSPGTNLTTLTRWGEGFNKGVEMCLKVIAEQKDNNELLD